jgi:hypothetical protein
VIESFRICLVLQKLLVIVVIKLQKLLSAWSTESTSDVFLHSFLITRLFEFLSIDTCEVLNFDVVEELSHCLKRDIVPGYISAIVGVGVIKFVVKSETVHRELFHRRH